MKNIAIIGCGNFGKLLIEILNKKSNIFIYDKDTTTTNSIILKDKNIKILNQNNISKIDYIIFSVPAKFLEDSIIEWHKYISENTIITDVLSVKLFPKKLLEKYFNKNEIICTHPLFGPNSIKRKLPNLTVMIDNISSSKKNFNALKVFIENFGFKTLEMTCDKHDKKMSYIHVLSHFIGKGIDYVPFNNLTDIKTLSFDFMKDLHNNVNNGGDDLFETIQKFNPYAKETRDYFIKNLIKINKKLNEK